MVRHGDELLEKLLKVCNLAEIFRAVESPWDVPLDHLSWDSELENIHDPLVPLEPSSFLFCVEVLKDVCRVPSWVCDRLDKHCLK
jgi:hypothetical protein